MLVSDFDLAFEVIHAFGLSHSQIYAAAARKLAEQGDFEGVLQLLRNIKSTSTDQERDQVSSFSVVIALRLDSMLSLPICAGCRWIAGL